MDPKTGKKADLMFVQHMLASLKTEGHMATVMPHGVLFRGGKEKLIRELFINDDIIEAIISLPPGLFYGTGIPACVIVCNKSKPDELRDKVLFINADREFAEGKNQNKLRPEDIEKIDFVFTHKRELDKYSLFPLAECVAASKPLDSCNRMENDSLNRISCVTTGRPEGAKTYQPRARHRECCERCRRPGSGVHPIQLP
jgi:type I restriction-modification system DNA methylase subunit